MIASSLAEVKERYATSKSKRLCKGAVHFAVPRDEDLRNFSQVVLNVFMPSTSHIIRFRLRPDFRSTLTLFWGFAELSTDVSQNSVRDAKCSGVFQFIKSRHFCEC
jgi:hypothetical protein